MPSAAEALERLREGNRRFVAGESHAEVGTARRVELAGGQQPFAIVLGCADSRVPLEIVFDQGLGDLFVVRLAGNIASRSAIGSIEFAAASFGTRLVVVLGHERCGAVKATLDTLRGSTDLSDALRAVVERVRPAVEEVLAAEPGLDDDAIVQRAVLTNVRQAADTLRNDSETLARLIRDDGLVVVGAEYRLETGEVEFLDRA